MSIATPSWLPGRPVRQFNEQLLFVLLCMAGYALAIMAITFGVSLFRDIEMSGWSLASGTIRWFCFVIGCYLGYSVLPLHVTHGQTRHDFLVRAALFVPLYGALTALAFTAVFYLEAGYYGLMGWQQAVEGHRLYTGPFQSHLIFLETWLIVAVWSAWGIAMGGAWYRSASLGALLILLGLLVSLISSASFGAAEGPLVWLNLVDAAARPSLWIVILIHLAALAIGYAIAWRTLRHVPIHTKTEDA